MLLSIALDLNNRLSKYRLEMLDLAKLRGINDPEVINIRKKIDQERDTLQKLIIYEQSGEDTFMEDSPYFIAWSWKGGEEDSQGL